MIHSTSFNQDGSHFTAALDSGFRVYACEPFRLTLRRSFDEEEQGGEGAGIGRVEMLQRSNYIGLVGGGKSPKYAPNKAVLWDEAAQKAALELEFRAEVRAIRLRKDRIVVVLKNRVYVYTLTLAPARLHLFETCDNERGVAALCASPSCSLLAIPGERVGHVHLIDLARSTSASVTILAAHEHGLAYLAFNLTGTRLATASTQGTLIRVYDTSTGKLCHELRRGSDPAEIYCLAFNAESTRLAVSSDKGTVHLFNLLEEPSSTRPCMPSTPCSATERSSLAIDLIKDYLPKYFSSQWSFAQIKLPELAPTATTSATLSTAPSTASSSVAVSSACQSSAPSLRIIVAFGSANMIHIINNRDGLFYAYLFDPSSGNHECIRQSQIAFLQVGE